MAPGSPKAAAAASAADFHDCFGSAPSTSPSNASPTSAIVLPAMSGTTHSCSFVMWFTRSRTVHSLHGVGPPHWSSRTASTPREKVPIARSYNSVASAIDECLLRESVCVVLLTQRRDESLSLAPLGGQCSLLAREDVALKLQVVRRLCLRHRRRFESHVHAELVERFAKAFEELLRVRSVQQARSRVDVEDSRIHPPRNGLMIGVSSDSVRPERDNRVGSNVQGEPANAGHGLGFVDVGTSAVGIVQPVMLGDAQRSHALFELRGTYASKRFSRRPPLGVG